MNTVKTSKGYTNVKDLIASELGPLTNEENMVFELEEVEQDISETLFSMRLARNISREDLAARIGVDVQDIVRLESDGNAVLFADVLKIASALGYHLSLQDSVDEGSKPVSLDKFLLHNSSKA